MKLEDQNLFDALTCKIFIFFSGVIIILYDESEGTAVAQLVEALRYKSEGRGFDSRWCH